MDQVEDLGSGTGGVAVVTGEKEVVAAQTEGHSSVMEQLDGVDRVVGHLEPIANVGGEADLNGDVPADDLFLLSNVKKSESPSLYICLIISVVDWIGFFRVGSL